MAAFARVVPLRSNVIYDLHSNANHLYSAPFHDAHMNTFTQGTSFQYGTFPFDGKATDLLGFISIPMLATSRYKKDATSTVSDVTSTIPMLTSSG